MSIYTTRQGGALYLFFVQFIPFRVFFILQLQQKT